MFFGLSSIWRIIVVKKKRVNLERFTRPHVGYKML
jgi:hypothetical protein